MNAKANFTNMAASTAADWRIIIAEAIPFAKKLPDRVLAHLRLLRRRLRRVSRRSSDALLADGYSRLSKTHVDALIASDSELSWSTKDYVDMSDDSGRVTRFESCFWWYRNEIRCAGPSEDQLAKMVEMAVELDHV